MDNYLPFRRVAEPTSCLEQGDLLKPTDALTAVLKEYHPYYASKTSNELFAVLTQSCDLVVHGAACKARYISLGPVRPLQEIASRDFEASLTAAPGGEIVIGTHETRDRHQEFLRKLFNNNDPRYFFVPERPDLGVSTDMCVMLPLSVSIKVEHYETLKDARIAQIDDLYQAKLGWLLGQQFSRVGTPDWPEDLSKSKAETVTMRSKPIWVQDREYMELRRQFVKFAQDHPGEPVDAKILQVMKTKLPSRIDEAISAAFAVLISQNVLAPGQDAIKPVLRKLLKADPLFSSFFK